MEKAKLETAVSILSFDVSAAPLDTISLQEGRPAVVVATTRYFCDVGSWTPGEARWPFPEANIVECFYYSPARTGVPDAQLKVKCTDISPVPLINDQIDVTTVMPTGPLVRGQGTLAMMIITHMETLPGFFGRPYLLYIATRIQVYQGSQLHYSRDFHENRTWFQNQASVTFEIT